jgi:hypothetical protein
MKRLSGVLLLVVCAIGGAYAQAPPSEHKSDQAPVVEVVGCLSRTGAEWVLAKAGDPAVTSTSFTTPEEVKAAAEKPLGTRQYRLIGAGPFTPESHQGHKLVVKGLLTKSSSDPSINLTSFQMLSETCAK